MLTDAPSFFRVYYTAVVDMGFEDGYWHASQTPLPIEITGLDPIAANEVVQEKLRTLHPDEQLLDLYDAVCNHQSESFGEPYYFDDDHPFILSAAEAAWRSGRVEF